MTSPSVIYHYTDAPGLNEIVRSRKLWATDIEFMNDAQEGRYGRAELRQALTDEADRLQADPDGATGPNAERAAMIRSVVDHLDPDGVYARHQGHVTYACCFCADSDLLSQWRGYAGSGGYAIGFDPDVLAGSRPPTWPTTGPRSTWRRSVTVRTQW